MAPPVDDALDLFALMLEALAVAHTELVQLGETGIPVPDSIEQLGREHGAMKATLARLPASLRQRAVAVYREEFERVRSSSVELSVPVLAEVLAQLDEVVEVVRRRRLCSLALDRALYDLGVP